ncbi:simple sugar transport system permease protein [Kribbella orskensis]|uniref:Simple sugar transport system permease protein n=1 Tax=Kribbella orskensis TaxID=2512216 RepID=A0ABY2BZN6_9ACTN|nr:MULTISPECIES: ABC transporter permease [Kribbella]TCN44059.1 simple sugar transport system permease protein [Kribbella sp. VKM Ac-2500]TCO32163.1 simple sugar transport system permease protein [Kribbella orskensis]
MSNDTATEPEQTPVPAEPAKESGSGLPNWAVQGLVSLSAIVLALVVGAILIIIGDDDVKAAAGYFGAAPMDTVSAALTAVGEAYKALFLGAVGGVDQIAESLTQATPLICGGLAVSLAFRAGLFNIGAQGQLIIGAIFASYVGFAWDLPPGLHLLVAVIAGLIGGALWGGVVGVLKARTGAHEVIVTIMLNYVAIYLLVWLLTTTTFKRPGRDDPISPIVKPNAQFPQFGDTRLHAGFLLALLAAVFVWWLLNRSTVGFELRAVGANADASRTAGMSVGRAYVIAMVIAGALAGLAGSQQVLGTDLPLTDGVAATIGFDAITVALLGRGTPLGTVLAGLLFGALNAGGLQMQLQTQTPLTLTTVLQAVIVLFVAAPALVRSIFPFLPKERGAGAVLAKGWNG